jgi:hypothetical protein
VVWLIMFVFVCFFVCVCVSGVCEFVCVVCAVCMCELCV